MQQLTQLRFHRSDTGDTDVLSLKTIAVDFSTIAPEQRALILQRLDGIDVWAKTWSNLRDGQRTENSFVVRATHRVIAREATLKSLIEAIQQNERDVMTTNTFKYTHALH